eukprot:493918_1
MQDDTYVVFLSACNSRNLRESQMKRAMVVLSIMAQAYIFENPDAVEDQIPACIAVPLCDVAEHLRVPPILSHMSIVLNNWRKIDPDGPLVASNLESLCRFHRIKDEDHFYMSTVEIEAYGGPAIALLVEAQEIIRCYLSHSEPPNPLSTVAPWKEASLRLVQCLQYVSKSIESMCGTLKRIWCGCDPERFYNQIRVFMQGYKGNPTLPSGVTYGGTAVDESGMEKRHFYCGGSAAQCTLFPVVDAILGVQHDPSKTLTESRDYMPEKHRFFLRAVEDKDRPSLSTFVLDLAKKAPELTEVERNIVEAYKSALDKLQAFRSYHMCIASSHILKPSTKVKSASASYCCASSMAPLEGKGTCLAPLQNSAIYAGTTHGTGGTNIMKFLKPLYNDVKSTQKNFVSNSSISGNFDVDGG